MEEAVEKLRSAAGWWHEWAERTRPAPSQAIRWRLWAEDIESDPCKMLRNRTITEALRGAARITSNTGGLGYFWTFDDGSEIRVTDAMDKVQ